MRQVGNGDVNFVQTAHSNGHFGVHGLKVSSVLQDDGMRLAHLESLRRYDSGALHRSNIIEMIGQPRIRPDLRVPKCSSEKACGRNEVNQPRCTEVELANLTLENKELAKEHNHKNRTLHHAIEDQFNNKMRKFAHTDYFAKHRLLSNSIPNEIQLRTSHYSQTFFNLCACVENHRS